MTLFEQCNCCGSYEIEHKTFYWGYVNKKLKQKATHLDEYDQCNKCGNMIQGSSKLIEKEELK